VIPPVPSLPLLLTGISHSKINNDNVGAQGKYLRVYQCKGGCSIAREVNPYLGGRCNITLVAITPLYWWLYYHIGGGCTILQLVALESLHCWQRIAIYTFRILHWWQLWWDISTGLIPTCKSKR